MFQSHFGEFAALLTAMFWTVTALAFESAGKKVGSLAVNFIRLIMAFVLISIYTLITRGMFLPMDASAGTWSWLLISGLIGFVLGDLFLFQAYVEIGSRISQLIFASSALITAIISYIVFDEKLTSLTITGMIITVLGIIIVVFKKDGNESKIELAHPIKGITFAFLGAIGQAVGTIFSKLGMGTYNPFAATQIRIIAGIIGFTVLICIMKKWGDLAVALKNTAALKIISVGALFGPFLGVSFSLLALQHAAAGIVSTITSITPVLIILPAVYILKEKVTSREIVGSVVAIMGISILFI